MSRQRILGVCDSRGFKLVPNHHNSLNHFGLVEFLYSFRWLYEHRTGRYLFCFFGSYLLFQTLSPRHCWSSALLFWRTTQQHNRSSYSTPLGNAWLMLQNAQMQSHHDGSISPNTKESAQTLPSSVASWTNIKTQTYVLKWSVVDGFTACLFLHDYIHVLIIKLIHVTTFCPDRHLVCPDPHRSQANSTLFGYSSFENSSVPSIHTLRYTMIYILYHVHSTEIYILLPVTSLPVIQSSVFLGSTQSVGALDITTQHLPSREQT